MTVWVEPGTLVYSEAVAEAPGGADSELKSICEVVSPSTISELDSVLDSPCVITVTVSPGLLIVSKSNRTKYKAGRRGLRAWC